MVVEGLEGRGIEIEDETMIKYLRFDANLDQQIVLMPNLLSLYSENGGVAAAATIVADPSRSVNCRRTKLVCGLSLSACPQQDPDHFCVTSLS